MPVYKVTVTKTLEWVFEIDAKYQDDAEDMANDMACEQKPKSEEVDIESEEVEE